MTSRNCLPKDNNTLTSKNPFQDKSQASALTSNKAELGKQAPHNRSPKETNELRMKQPQKASPISRDRSSSWTTAIQTGQHGPFHSPLPYRYPRSLVFTSPTLPIAINPSFAVPLTPRKEPPDGGNAAPAPEHLRKCLYASCLSFPNKIQQMAFNTNLYIIDYTEV